MIAGANISVKTLGVFWDDAYDLSQELTKDANQLFVYKLAALQAGLF